MASNDEKHARSATAAVSGGWSVAASTDAATRRSQRELVALLVDESEPNESMRALAEEYRRDVDEGLIKSA